MIQMDAIIFICLCHRVIPQPLLVSVFAYLSKNHLVVEFATAENYTIKQIPLWLYTTVILKTLKII